MDPMRRPFVRHLLWLLVALLIALLTACSPARPAPSLGSPTPTAPATHTPVPSEPPAITPPAVAPSPSPTAAVSQTTPTAPATAALCSPLQGIPVSGLAAAVSNPYHPPRPGSDDPHHGVDFADRSGPEGAAVPGMPVQAVLPGVVASVTRDRFPYGNALMVETPLDELPPLLLESLQLPTPQPEVTPISLTCPELPAPAWDSEQDPSRRSLYLLYAHLGSPTELEPGDPVSCGDALGAVGMSGNALNPHLHLEVRLGSAGARLPGMAHYDASASVEEMASYCAWRVRGFFQLLDPLQLFAPPQE